VIVDLAAEQGGNCDLTVPDQVIEHHGVTIIGYTDLTSRLATQASALYATNVQHLMVELTPNKDGQFVVNMDDEVLRGATVINSGATTWPPPPPKVAPAPAAPEIRPSAARPGVPLAKPRQRRIAGPIAILIGAALLALIGANAPTPFMQHLTVFILACFVGFHVIWNVTPALHTPLMSVTNAISGIIVIGALLQIGSAHWIVALLAGVSMLIATINIAGGFWVTYRMLKMFRRD
jgi:NAD(P) transhydrogenase subunit alpha